MPENRDMDTPTSSEADAAKKAAGVAIAQKFDAMVRNDAVLQAQLAGMARADADEKKADEKPEIEDKKGDQEEDDGSGKVLSALDKIADALGGLAGRIDALETAREEHALQC